MLKKKAGEGNDKYEIERERIIKIYEETKCVVRIRIEEEYRKRFWTRKKIRRGYPLSPILLTSR